MVVIINKRISASLLAADFCHINTELERVSGADLLHIDVMDGSYVPNISFGPPVIAAVRRCSQLPLDIHLMVQNPERHLATFAAFKPEFLTVHYEATVHLQRTLSKIRELGIKAGVALNPHTPLDGLKYVLSDLDLILIMTVNPGYGGQEFIPAMYDKIRKCRDMVGDLPIELQVDGGVGLANAAELAEAGVTNFVAGTAIFQADNPNCYMDEMRACWRKG